MLESLGANAPKDNEIPITPEMAEALSLQREAFIAKFGREPGPDDPLLFDPDADTPQPVDMDLYEKELAEAIVTSSISQRTCSDRLDLRLLTRGERAVERGLA